jgi:hypothetical protein
MTIKNQMANTTDFEMLTQAELGSVTGGVGVSGCFDISGVHIYVYFPPPPPPPPPPSH